MKKIVITVMVLAMASMGALQAQNTFSLRAGLALPMGNYASATADYTNNVLRYGLLDQTKKGGAGMGFCAGMQEKFGFSGVKGFGIIVSADFFYNSTNTDVSDFYEEYVSANETSTKEYSFTLPKYIHVPIMAGVNYTYDINDKIGVFGEGALGVNLRFITGYEAYAATTTTENIGRISYKTATTFAYRFGCGIIFAKRFTLGLSYIDHGSSKVKGEATSETNGVTNPGTTNLKGGKIAATNLAIRFGLNF